jgi:electron transport complex protein RnfE
MVTNCIVLGRQEAFASRNPVGRSVLDALGSGAGFTLALLMMGIPREVLGNGTFMGVNVMGPRFEPWVVMILPPGGFLMIGVWLVLVSWREQRKARARARAQQSSAAAAALSRESREVMA